MKYWPTWMLGGIVLLCSPVLLWLGELKKPGLAFMRIVNDPETVWNFATSVLAAWYVAVFLFFGTIALYVFVISAACTTVLVNRAMGDDARKNP